MWKKARKKPIVIEYIEQDDEYMYFEVFELNEDEMKYESRGTIYIGKVKGIER